MEQKQTSASRSFVAIASAATVSNVVALPQRSEDQPPAIGKPSEPARILDYKRPELMTDPKKKPQVDENEQARIDQKLLKLFRRLHHPETELTEQMVDEMLRITEPAQPEQESR